jgi:hypothetical protein
MIRSILVIIVLVGQVSISPLLASELEIEVAIASPTDPYSTQVVPFEFDLPVDRISLVYLRLSGTYSDQTFLCGSTPGMVTETEESRLLVSLGDDVNNAPAVQVPHSFPANSGAPLDFDINIPLLSRPDGDWNFLADGIAQLGFSDNPQTVYDSNYLRCYPGEVFGTVTSATLVLVYDVGVASQAVKWASLKALYR